MPSGAKFVLHPDISNLYPEQIIDRYVRGSVDKFWLTAALRNLFFRLPLNKNVASDLIVRR